MSMPDLETLYMPSNWSKRAKGDKLLEDYFKFCEDITKKARSSIENKLDIPYGDTERSKYDIYGTNLPNDSPILLFIHGGYWTEFSKDQSGFMVPNFVKNGIQVIIANYDLCPNVTLTEIVSQVKTLVEKVLEYAKKRGSKGLWIAGHSAGAHLAASLIHNQTWVDSVLKKNYNGLLKGLILIAGIYYLEPLLQVSVNEFLRLTRKEIKDYSFLQPKEKKDNDNDITNDLEIKVIVTVGECDSPKFVQESRLYTRKLVKFLDNVEFLHLRDNIDHFDIVEKLIDQNFFLSRKLCNEINQI